jgi:hypothetical protein
MNYQTAFEILEIDFTKIRYNEINLKYLTPIYRKLALKHHPDKNGNTEESKEKFQKINEAYEVIQTTLREGEKEKEEEEDTYSYFLNMFLGEKNDSAKIKDAIFSLLTTSCNKITIHLFEKMERDTAMETYTFLSKYKDVLHIDEATMETVKKTIQEKYKNVEIIELHPTLHDLLENKVFKMEWDGQLYYVPLWHSEIIFESKALDVGEKDIVVKCIPNLPTHVSIDENNNLIVVHRVPFSFSLFASKTIPIVLDSSYCINQYHISLDQLSFKQEQIIVLKREGIAKIDEKDMYNADRRADVVVKIQFYDPAILI